MQPAVAAKRFLSCFYFRLCAAFVVVASIFLISTSANAQTDFTRIYGSEDQTVPMPGFVGTLGQKDAGALQERLDYLKAVNILDWKGMQASGTLTDDSGNTNQATLAILNADHSRLDVQTPNGERSARISGIYGATLEADGKSFFMPPATAKAGLLAFPRLLIATFPSSNTALIDRGLVQVGTQSLHRLTLEESIFSDVTIADGRDINVTDLYFDPSTHLLLKSAAAVQLDSADRERYLIVISYSNYQGVQGSLVPCTYRQSLNGQQQWTLQISTPDLQPSFAPNYFHF